MTLESGVAMRPSYISTIRNQNLDQDQSQTSDLAIGGLSKLSGAAVVAFSILVLFPLLFGELMFASLSKLQLS